MSCWDQKYPGIENTKMFTLLKECMKERKKGFIENEFTFPDGSIEFFELSIQPVPEGVFIISLNTTERKKALAQLAASELKFRSLLENSNDIVTMLDTNLNIIYRSPSATRLLGWTDDDMLGIRGIDNIHPIDRMIFNGCINDIKKNPGVPFDICFRMKHKLGHYLIIDGSINNLLEDENIQAIVFNFRDVTEKKKAADELVASERQYSNLIDRISDGFMSLDNDLRITYVNNVAEKMFDTPAGYLTGKKLYEEYSRGIDSVIYNSIVESLKTKKPKRIDTYSDVFQKWIIGSIYPSSTGLTCFFRDNTEYKKMEQELQEQQHQEQSKLISATLEAQEKERNAIGIELHDNVNQILVGTTMFLSMLKKKPEKDDELITECIDHIKQAINENRKIAHILVSPDMGNKHLTEQISSLCGNMLQANGIKTIANFDDYNYRLLSKDMKVALYRIVQEQFTNIIKYAEAKEVNIKLETTNKLLRMRIADNGKGMDGDTFTHGIGLRNIGSRLSVFGGDMKVKTSSGKGFELVVEIPLN